MNKASLSLFLPGAVLVALPALWNRGQWGPSFHYAFIIWLSVSLGALALLMTHHLSGGRWGFAVRRIMEAALAPFPLLAIFFLILFAVEPRLRAGEGYFQSWWILLRGIIYFILWTGMAWALRSLSIKQDGVADLRYTRTLRTLSGPGLVVYFISVSFAMVDWLMQLEPGWRSTMFPGIMMASQTLLALAGATVAARYLFPEGKAGVPPFSARIWLDLGTLLFAFVIFWAYVAFSQLLIIWAGNLPAEIVWYLRRSESGWLWMARVIGAICFFAPAGVLLFQVVKRHGTRLTGVAVAIWISQAFFLYWVVMPSFFPAFHVSVADFLLPAGMGAMWCALFWRAWKSAPPIPINDPRLEPLGVEPVSPK